MSTTPLADISTETADQPASADQTQAPLLICLPYLSSDGLQLMQTRIAAALPHQPVHVAAPDAFAGNGSEPGITLVAYPTEARAHSGWVLTAYDFHAASELAVQQGAAATILLGAEAASLSQDALLLLAGAVLSGGADLALPRYNTGPRDALLSSALLSPLTRALFGVEAHLPLPLDVAFSSRMAARLRVAARKPNPAENEALLWAASEASVASFSVHEVDAGERTLPHPGDIDLNTLLNMVAGSLFTDIEAKANFWQRARVAAPINAAAELPASTASSEDLTGIQEMAESFRLAFVNLQEIWSLVLPPQSLLALKKVSQTSPDAFTMPPKLWARTVYDFVLAYHLRTINRSHLLGAFTPLYLAWVASHLRLSGGDASLAAQQVEQTAAAFVAEKPYIVSRWRWPDRFNP